MDAKIKPTRIPFLLSRIVLQWTGLDVGVEDFCRPRHPSGIRGTLQLPFGPFWAEVFLSRIITCGVSDAVSTDASASLRADTDEDHETESELETSERRTLSLGWKRRVRSPGVDVGTCSNSVTSSSFCSAERDVSKGVCVFCSVLATPREHGRSSDVSSTRPCCCRSFPCKADLAWLVVGRRRRFLHSRRFARVSGT